MLECGGWLCGGKCGRRKAILGREDGSLDQGDGSVEEN